MNKKKIQHIILLLIFTCTFQSIVAQDDNSMESSMIKKANKIFDHENWEEAIPLFAQLVSVYPKNADYNYKLGVCILMGDRSDRAMPIRYLENAHSSMPDNTKLMYYLGLAYYHNQEYQNALHFFKMYKAKENPEFQDGTKLFDLINASQNGVRLAHKNMIAEIISKNEFQHSNFHRAYSTNEINGGLIQKPEQFLSSAKNDNDFNKFVYISDAQGILYFSGYEDHSNNRDIFSVTYDDDGNWSEPIKITGKINTFFDEDFPVITDQGRTLYFSSKGHNSLGGYDIYKSTFDSITQSFSAPENMGDGINSPFDDFLYIPDKTGNYAFFSSNRDNLDNDINFYKIRLMDEEKVMSKLQAYEKKAAKEKSYAGYKIIPEADYADEKSSEIPDRPIVSQPEQEEDKAKIHQKEDPVHSNSSLLANEGVGENLDKYEDPSQKTNKNQMASAFNQISFNTPVQSKDQQPKNAIEKDHESIMASNEKEKQNSTGITSSPETSSLSKIARVGSPVNKEDSKDPILVKNDETMVKTNNGEKQNSTEKIQSSKTNSSPALAEVEAPVLIRDDKTELINEDDEKQNSIEKSPALKTSSSSTIGQVELPDLIDYSKQPVMIKEDEISVVAVSKKQSKAFAESDQSIKQGIDYLKSINYDHPKQHQYLTQIKTEKNHHELISTARINPDSLTYEELLLAADLIPNAMEKLALYNVAFVRIDRDYRAYKSASLAAREIIQKDYAEVYQYQALLIKKAFEEFSDEELVFEIDLENWLSLCMKN